MIHPAYIAVLKLTSNVMGSVKISIITSMLITLEILTERIVMQRLLVIMAENCMTYDIVVFDSKMT